MLTNNPLPELIQTYGQNDSRFKSHPLGPTLDYCTGASKIVDEALAKAEAAAASGRFSDRGLTDERLAIGTTAIAAIKEWVSNRLDNPGVYTDGRWVSPKLAIAKLREVMAAKPQPRALDVAERIELALRRQEVRLQMARTHGAYSGPS